MVSSRERLGQILIESKQITEEQLKEALSVQTKTRKRLGQILVDKGFCTEAEVTRALAVRMGLTYIDLSEIKIDPTAAMLISERLARRYVILPIGFEEKKLVVVMADPANIFAIDDLRIMTGYEIKPVVSSESEILKAISDLKRVDETMHEIIDESEAEEDVDFASIREVVDDAPIVKLVNMVLGQAISDGASDIHFEPQEKELRIRFRVDGVLHEIMASPKRIQAGVISRLKIMSDMNIAERRVPQDGRAGFAFNGKAVDMRVASLPTVYGEKIVIRILDKSSVLMKLTDLGFNPNVLKRYESSFKKPYGAILVTGPTGSGKSTTLYATLNVLNSPEKNIITVEDPVEYRLGGICQVQINPKAGLTFAAGLKSILRCDPDIVMIGEIRDKETAQIAVESALTGHLVLSTLHTNDAPGALLRMTEMGVEPFLIASAVDCVLAQRLARKLCSSCKEEYEPTVESLKVVNFPTINGEYPKKLHRAKGCKKCGSSGYKGRIGVYEVMMVSETIERMITVRASTEEVAKVAIQEGMVNLRNDGLDKVRQGITSIEEILRVIR